MTREEIEKLIDDLEGMTQTEPDGTKWCFVKRKDLISLAEKIGYSEKPNNLPGFDTEQDCVPGRDFVPVAWVETLEQYGKWQIVPVGETEGLDEAALIYSKMIATRSHEEGNLRSAFKAGAKWAFGQFESLGTFPVEDARGGYWPTKYFIRKK